MTDPYFNSLMIHRQVMSWSCATRLQLDRWEIIVGERVRLSLHDKGELPGADIWQAQFEHHFALIACRHLLQSLGLAATPVEVDPTLAAEIVSGRDLHEHWVDNMPVFNVRPRKMTPPRKSGRGFAERNPERSPYGWLAWSSAEGPMLLPNVPAATVHDLLDRAEAWVEGERPELAVYRFARLPSPWVGPDAGADRWWPGTQG